MKMSLHHHQKLNVGNISAVTHPILTKIQRQFSWLLCQSDICPGNFCPVANIHACLFAYLRTLLFAYLLTCLSAYMLAYMLISVLLICFLLTYCLIICLFDYLLFYLLAGLHSLLLTYLVT